MMNRANLILAVSAAVFIGLAGCANQQGGDAAPSVQDKLAKFRVSTMTVSAGMGQQEIESKFGRPDRTVDSDGTQLLSRLRASYVLVYDHPSDIDVKFVVGFSQDKTSTDSAIWKTTEGGLASFGKLVRPVDYWAKDNK
ncbi:MAG: hypothetical protein HZA50_01730 [Planctomycetes bacterium]|nr:hypothetical protein [Planctomycetota bacterium]